MATEIVMNITREGKRVAVLENKCVTELYIERLKTVGSVGNVYKGKVARVLPGMQAAFVDIGLKKSAFLYVDEVSLGTSEMGADDYSHWLAASAAQRGEEPVEFDPSTGSPSVRKPRGVSIEHILKEGQDITVQVTKEPIGTKGPRVTTYVSLPGRYLVLMPAVNHVGISRKISKDEERVRLRETIMRMRKPGRGYIVRTVSEGMTEEELRADMQFLDLLWQDILKRRDGLSAPALLYRELDLILRIIRDLLTRQVDRVTVDSLEECERIKEFARASMPELVDRVTPYTSAEPIFDAFEIEVEIARALGRKVWLKSGGYLVLEHTEACLVVDVNTGRYVGRKNLEETVLKTNLEAVKELAYQLQLRNIGGLIVVDFIDMEREANREQVVQVLHEAMARDRAKTTILRISDLGLVEMSRERTRENLTSLLCEPCSGCEGQGYIKSATTVCYEIFREIRRLSASKQDGKIIVTAHPAVANLMHDEEREGLDDLERTYHKRIVVKADVNLRQAQYKLVTL